MKFLLTSIFLVFSHQAFSIEIDYMTTIKSHEVKTIFKQTIEHNLSLGGLPEELEIIDYWQFFANWDGHIEEIISGKGYVFTEDTDVYGSVTEPFYIEFSFAKKSDPNTQNSREKCTMYLTIEPIYDPGGSYANIQSRILCPRSSVRRLYNTYFERFPIEVTPIIPLHSIYNGNLKRQVKKFFTSEDSSIENSANQ